MKFYYHFLLLLFFNTICFSQNLQWAKQIGGTGYDIGLAVAIAATGDIYLTGYFEGNVDFDPNAGTFVIDSADTMAMRKFIKE